MRLRLRGKAGIVIAAVVAVAGGLVVGLWLWLGRGGGGEGDGAGEDAGAPVAGGSRDAPRLAVQPRAGTGPHKASGAVLDVAGRPVAGAVVTAEIELGPGVDSMARPGLATDPAVIAVAADDGAFVLEGLEAGRHRMRVEAPDIFTAEVRFVEVPSEGLRLVVARRVEVHGLVREAGRPAAGVQVSLSTEAGSVDSATSGADGSFAFSDLAQGVFQVWAIAPGRAARAQRIERMEPPPAAGWPPVMLELEPAEVVSGRVVERGGGGVAAAVRLTPDAAGEAPRFARSGPDGRFSIEGVLPGPWTAEAFAPGYLAVDEVHFTVVSAPAGYSPTIELVRGGIARGVVVNVDGTPVRGASVAVRGKDAGGADKSYDQTALADRSDRITGRATGPVIPGQRFIPRGELGVLLGPIPFPPPPGATRTRIAQIVDATGAPADDQVPAPRPELEPRFVTDDQGRFQVTGLPAGSFRVTAAHPDYADGESPSFNLRAGQERSELKVVLHPGVMITGTVKNDHGELVVGATIVADRLDGKATPDLRLQGVTGVDGHYQLGPLATGVQLRVTAVGHGDAERRIEIEELGRRRVDRVEDFVLARADAALDGRVVDGAGFPVRGAVVALVRRDRFQSLQQATTDDGGRFTIPGLASGTYPLTVEHADFPPAQVKGKTGEPLQISLPFGGAIDAQVRDAGTLAAVVGARVTATGPGGARAQGVAGDQGELELGPLVPGAWKLEVEAPGYVPATQSVDVPAGNRPGAITVNDLRLDLRRGATIGGTVVDANGQRVRGARVEAGGRSTTTDELGRFRLTDVPAGELTVEASKEDARGSERLTLTPGDQQLSMQISLQPAD